MNRKNVNLPIAVVINANLSTSAKVIYAVLKSFQTGNHTSQSVASVVVTHGQIIEKSNLSKHTIAKALNQLVVTGWIEQQRNIGSANRYIFTSPISGI